MLAGVYPDAWDRVRSDGRVERTFDRGRTWAVLPPAGPRPWFYITNPTPQAVLRELRERNPDMAAHELVTDFYKKQLYKLVAWIRSRLGIDDDAAAAARTPAELKKAITKPRARASYLRREIASRGRKLAGEIEILNELLAVKPSRATQRTLRRALARIDHEIGPLYDELQAIAPSPRGLSLIDRVGRPPAFDGEMFDAVARATGTTVREVLRLVYANLDDVETFVTAEAQRFAAQRSRVAAIAGRKRRRAPK